MIFETIVKYISEQLPTGGKTITRETKLVDDLGADSASVMMLIMDLETEFGITMDDDMLMKIETIGDIEDYVKERVN